MLPDFLVWVWIYEYTHIYFKVEKIFLPYVSALKFPFGGGCVMSHYLRKIFWKKKKRKNILIIPQGLRWDPEFQDIGWCQDFREGGSCSEGEGRIRGSQETWEVGAKGQGREGGEAERWLYAAGHCGMWLPVALSPARLLIQLLKFWILSVKDLLMQCRVSQPWNYGHVGLDNPLLHWRVSAASLTSTGRVWMAAPLSSCDNWKYLQTLPTIPGEQNQPWLKAAVVMEMVERATCCAR